MVNFGVFFVLTDSVRFPDFYAQTPVFTPIYFLCICTSICHLCLSSVGGARVLRDQGGWYDVRLVKKRNNFARVGTKIFWRTIYCTNPNPKPDPQYSSLSHKGLGIWAPWIIWEYDLDTAIEIRPLTDPRMWKMGFSIFFCHGSTQIREYDLGFYPENALDR